MKKFNRNNFRQELYKSPMNKETFNKWMDNPKNFNDKGVNNTRDKGKYWDKIRKLFNQVHGNQNSLQIEDVKKIDDNFFSETINLENYFNRLSIAPMSDETFEKIKNSNDKAHQFDILNSNSDLFFLNNVRKDINQLHQNKKQNIFLWVAWFGELVSNISKQDEYSFPNLVKQAIHDDSQSIIRLKAYDPFSFLYYLAQRNTRNQKQQFFTSVSEVFNIQAKLPDFDCDDCWIFPTPTSNANALYRSDQQYNQNLLWDFFQQVVSIKSFEELISKTTGDKFVGDFKTILNLKNIGVAKLTQTLFILNPNIFFTIDWILNPISHDLLNDANTDAEKNIKVLIRSIEVEGFPTYLEIMQKIRTLFPNKNPYEINYYLLKNKNDINQQSLEEKPMINNTPLNQILYGPPGTGKTHSTIKEAVKLLEGITDDKVAKQFIQAEKLHSIQALQNKYKSQVEFVTFHQSFSYEDFVEGIKANSDSDKLSYPVEDGIFKKICESANGTFYSGLKIGKYKILSISNDLMKIQKQGGGIIPLPAYMISELINLVENNSLSIQDIKDKKAMDKMSKTAEKYIINGYHNIFAQLVEYYFNSINQKSKNNKNYVLIIDEINRGNISRIFGELITLIEPSKRLGSSEPLEVILPYSQKKFGVPHNLHIIATMNTADKSLMQIDTALRRRFQFIEMMPNNELVSEDCEGVNLKELLTAINARICQLLDREHQIGHSYLMGVDNILELKHRFRYQILPLLEEYFFSDWEQIKIVLNDKDTFYPKNDYGKYVLDKDNNTPYRSLSDSEWDGISQEAFINIYFTTEQNNQE